MATCPICFEDIQEKACPDSCDHVFCLPCLQKWSKLGSFCPVDRKRYRKIVNLESDSFIQVKSRKRKKSRAVYDFSAKCEVCEDERKPEVLLLCDCCDLAFHIYCLSPPLKAIPAGQWFCPTCTSVEKKLRERNGITKEVEIDLGNSNLLFQKNRRQGQRKKEKFPEVKEDPEPTLDELKTDKFIKDKMCNSSVEVCNDVVFEFECVSSRRYDNGKFLNNDCSSVDIDEKLEKMCKSFRFEPQSHKNKNIKVSKTYDIKKNKENLNAKIELEYINAKNKSADDLCLKHSNEVSLIDDCLSQAAAVGYLKFDSFEMSHGEEKYLNTKNKSADDLCPKHSNEVSLIDDCLSQAAAVGYLKFDSFEMSHSEEKYLNTKNKSANDLCPKHSNELSFKIDDCTSQAAAVGCLKSDEEKYLNQVSQTTHGILPSCSGVSDQSIKDRNTRRRRKYSTVHTSLRQPQIKLEDAVLNEEECFSTLLKPAKIIIKKEDQDVCESRVTGITKFHTVSRNESELSFVNRSNLQYLTIRDDGSFYLDIDNASTTCAENTQDNLSRSHDLECSALSSGNLVTKLSRLKNGDWSVNSAKMPNLVNHFKERDVLYRNGFNDMPVLKSYLLDDVDDNHPKPHSSSFQNLYSSDSFYRTEKCNSIKEESTLSRSDLKHLNIRSDGTFFLNSPASVDIKPDLEALRNTPGTSSGVKSAHCQELRHSDLKHLNIRSDGTFVLDPPTSVDTKPDLEALRNTPGTSSGVESAHRQELRHGDLKHLNIRSDGTFVLDHPTSVDKKPDLEALRNTPCTSSSDESSNDQELRHDNLKHLNIRSDGTFFLDSPTSLDKKPDLEALRDTPSSSSSDKSPPHQELRHGDLKHLIVRSDGTFFLDAPAATDIKPDLEALQNTCDTSSSNESLHHQELSHCGSEHLIVKKEETSFIDSVTSVDIKPDLKTLQNASGTSLENKSLHHQHLRHLTIRDDGTFFLDLPD